MTRPAWSSTLQSMLVHILLLCWLPALTLSSPVDRSDTLSKTCTDIELADGFSLRAQCLAAPSNHTLVNILDLNLCVGINYTMDQLQWSVYGKFEVYCSGCILKNTTVPSQWLTCTCQSVGSSGPATVSSLDLDDGIRNENGTLTCVGGGATTSTWGGH